MRLLVDIVHPADVLFFKRPIEALLSRGDSVIVASRKKDVATELLETFDIPHRVASEQGHGIVGLGLELARRDMAILRLARAQRPDVMVGFGGIAISHVGRLTGIPSVAFYDSETATLQTRLTWPFIHRLVVPANYIGKLPAKRTTRLAGTKELSYFHPSGFRPDRQKAIAQGLAPERRNVFVRLVRWGANHDVGKRGWSDEDAQALVTALGPETKLHVSAEADVPEALERSLWRGDPAQLHHLVGHCDAYVGESATMAAEAATMGVPAVYGGVDVPGYVRELASEGLVRVVPPNLRMSLGGVTLAMLEDAKAFSHRHSDWLGRCPDWSTAVVETIDDVVQRQRGLKSPS